MGSENFHRLMLFYGGYSVSTSGEDEKDDGIFIASKIDSAASSPRLFGEKGSMKHYTHMSCSPYHDLHFMKSRGDEGKSLHYENISSFCHPPSPTPSPLVNNFLCCASAHSSKASKKTAKFFFSVLEGEDNMMMCVNLIKEGVQMRAFCALLVAAAASTLSCFALSFEDFYFSICRQVLHATRCNFQWGESLLEKLHGELFRKAFRGLERNFQKSFWRS
jgi:hypothetical protein